MNTKNSLLTAMVLIYFFPKGEKSMNNSGQVAPAIILGRPWSTEALNLAVLADNGSEPVKVRSSVLKATSLADALNGNKWCSHQQAMEWGIDLSDGYQDIDKVLEVALQANANQQQAAEEALNQKANEDDTNTSATEDNGRTLAPEEQSADTTEKGEEEHESGKSSAPATE